MDVIELAARYADAINARDLDGATALLHPDIEYTSNGDVGPIEGQESVMLHFEALIEAGVQVEVVEQHATGPFVVSELQVTERRGDGIIISKDVIARQRWDDGLLVSHRAFADVPRLRHHLVD